MVSIAVAARVCKPYTPQTKGKVERTVSHVKTSLWGGITFTDLDDLNRQAHGWCERINARVHRTTHARPVDRLAEEKLLPLPQAFAWERFATEERKVTWDGYVSYDGVLLLGSQGRYTWRANRSRCVSAREWCQSGRQARGCLRNR